MTMESPVRIVLGAALVVNLLLLSSTTSGNALPHDTTPTTNTTTIKDERVSRFSRNGTWSDRRTKTPDVALNELHPKESVSEEHTEKNAKYKHRGRVRFNPSSKTSTESSFRRVRTFTTSTSTEAGPAAKLIIVTPTPEVKKPAQIIDSMRAYKKTKMPVTVSFTTSLPVSVKSESKSEEEYEDNDEEEKESFEKYTSSKFHDSNFFTIPSYNDDIGHDSKGSDNKVKPEYSSPSYDTFSSYFPEVSYGPKDNTDDEPYKSESFFDFDSELTTPKNDFFDKKFQAVSSSILKNLAKTKSAPRNGTNVYKTIQGNTGVEKFSKGIPSNKSTVIIKNTKEVRLLDNDKAGSENKELSDVHGTSVYYEMSVLSTETYSIHSNDDDCDNETLPEPTVSTSSEDELASLKGTSTTLLPVSTKPSIPDSESEAISTLSSNYLPYSTLGPTFFSSINPLSISTQNSVSSTEKKSFANNFTRNRNYSKRLNLTGVKDSPNSVTLKTDQPISNYNYRVPTRKFHYTTPKTKPIWMAPRRNVTRTSYTRSTAPTTIYSEHFNIKDKISTTERPKTPKTTLTTVSSDIDPVLQSDVSGVKKIVHSQSISDNSIPTLWKRGSTKYSTSTVTSAEEESGVSDLEIPPTLTAWALASLRSPPSMASPAMNATASTTKSIDENELQKVGEVADKKETTTSSTTTTVATTINNDIIPLKITEIEQNKLPWRAIVAPTAPGSETQTETTATETKSERLPAESNISIQSSAQPTTTEKMNAETAASNEDNSNKESKQSWVPVTADQTTEELKEETKEEIPPVDAPKSTGFESITKLPKGVTTPQGETNPSSEQKEAVTEERDNTVPTTTDYEITTIRFSYVPTEVTTETESTTTNWHPVFPTRTKITTLKDEPITTYRPKYMTTTDMVEETTTMMPETTPQIEVSSQIVENITEKTIETTEPTEMTEDTTTETPTTVPTTTKEIPVETTMISEPEDTTTMVIEVVTEINTEKGPTTTTELVSSTEVTETPSTVIRDSSSEENSGSNEVITQETTKIASQPSTTTKMETTTEDKEETTQTITEIIKEITTQENAKIFDTTIAKEETTVEVETTTEDANKSVSDLEDLTNYAGEVTTEASSRVLTDEAGSGAAIAIAVSTIGVIALILLVGLLLVVRRRGRRGVYAQRCTPVSLDAYSLDSVSVGHRKGNHRLRASKRSYGNPAYDDEVTSHPMQYAALANFALDVDSMSAEFAEIPSVTVRPDEVPPGCEDKNRYSNVLPLPETRVQLKRLGNDPTTEYINANYITGPGNIRNYYIACQAPLHNTVADFWRMIWEQNSRVIVMLTEYMENGVEKCYEYLPPSEVSDNKRTFGDYQIVLIKREQKDKYAISSVQLINLNTRTWREVTHLWYFWPAKGVPDDYDSVIDFLSEMRSYMKISQTAKEYDEEGVEVIYGDQSRSSFQNLSKLRSDDSSSGNGVNVYSPARAEEQLRRGNATNGTLGRMKAAAEVEGVRPCVVVCASGAGRSAAVIAADVCARALAAAAADVPRVVRELRAQRPHSLSNRHHYIFLYKVLSEYGNKLMGGGVDTI